jgi:hypothetical protein
MPRSELLDQLTNVNRSFNTVFKKNPELPAEDEELQAKYAELSLAYEDIVEAARNSNPFNSNNRTKFIELAARLGVIQCKMNSFQLSPTDESIIQNNDSQLELLKNELDQLNEENIALRKDFSHQKSNTFTSQLKKATRSWEIDKRNKQVAYYYNFACHILDSTTSLLPELIKKSIRYLEKSSNLYAQLEKLFCEQDEIQKVKKTVEYKSETDVKITETKKLLEQLQLNHCRVSIDLTRINTKKKIITDTQSDVTLLQKSSQSPAVTNASAHPIPLSIAATEKAVRATKRRHQSSEMPSGKRVKIPLEAIVDFLTLRKSNEELLNLDARIFQEIAASLEIPALRGNYFYIALITNVLQFIESTNYNELTQLRLAEIVLYFLTLPENLKVLKNKQQLFDNENSINSAYKDKFPLEERLKPEILQEKFQAEGGLKSLFLSEIKTYYFKQKITKPDNESRRNFLNEIHATIENSIKAAITENTLLIITRRMNNLPNESKASCLTSILQRLKEFYISPDQHQQNWLEENNIPIKSSNPRYPGFLDKLYKLINLHSAATGVRRIEFRDDKVYKLSFFPPKDITLTKEIFLTRIKEHLLILQTAYVTSSIKYSAICNRLTQLISTQIEQHATDQREIWRPYLP